MGYLLLFEIVCLIYLIDVDLVDYWIDDVVVVVLLGFVDLLVVYNVGFDVGWVEYCYFEFGCKVWCCLMCEIDWVVYGCDIWMLGGFFV